LPKYVKRVYISFTVDISTTELVPSTNVWYFVRRYLVGNMGRVVTISSGGSFLSDA